MQKITDALNDSIIGWLVAGAFGGLVWLTRRAITNQKQIELMRVSMESISHEQERDRSDFKDGLHRIEAAQTAMGADIKGLLKGSETK